MHCLVLAYKFNDILYAVNTEEYLQSTSRVLVAYFDAVPEGVADSFDKVITLSYKRSVMAMIRNVLNCRRTVGSSFFRGRGIFIASNYQVLNTRLYFSLLCPGFRGVYVEDGMMSYLLSSIASDSSGVERIPAIVQRIMGVDRAALAARVDVGYFLSPDLIGWIGDARKLKLEHSLGDMRAVSKHLVMLDGKSFFAGQPIYEHFDWYHKKKYIEKINQLYQDRRIDWYLPHPHEPVDVTAAIECPILQVSDAFQSFESVASGLKMVRIYTYFSSLAYTIPLLTDAEVFLVEDFVCSERYQDERVIKLLQRMNISYQLV